MLERPTPVAVSATGGDVESPAVVGQQQQQQQKQQQQVEEAVAAAAGVATRQDIATPQATETQPLPPHTQTTTQYTPQSPSSMLLLQTQVSQRTSSQVKEAF